MEPKELKEFQKEIKESLKKMTGVQLISFGERFGAIPEKEKKVKHIKHVDYPDNFNTTDEVNSDPCYLPYLTRRNMEALIQKQNEIIDVLNKFLDKKGE